MRLPWYFLKNIWKLKKMFYICGIFQYELIKCEIWGRIENTPSWSRRGQSFLHRLSGAWRLFVPCCNYYYMCPFLNIFFRQLTPDAANCTGCCAWSGALCVPLRRLSYIAEGAGQALHSLCSRLERQKKSPELRKQDDFRACDYCSGSRSGAVKR